MAVKTFSKPASVAKAAPAKTGNGKAIQRKVLPGLFTTGTVQRKAQPGGWVHQQAQRPVNARPLVQPKVNIHPSDDRFEKEADHVADKVTSNQPVHTAAAVSKVPVATQRKTNRRKQQVAAIQAMLSLRNTNLPVQTKQNNSLGESPDLQMSDSGPPAAQQQNQPNQLASVLSNQHTRGSPLPAATRAQMENRIGANFSNVRVHTGNESHEASRSIGARAFTNGPNIHFANGQYDPHSPTGKHLLAHELTHTIQQGAAPARADIQRAADDSGISATNLHDHAERGPPIQRRADATVQCALFDGAISRIGEVLNDLPSITEGLAGAKAWLLDKVRRFASFIPGYTALGVVLGQDPITGAPIERNGRNFIEAALDIIPGGGLLKQKLEELGAIDRAATWIDVQIGSLGSILQNVRNEFTQAWNGLGIGAILDGPLNVLRTFGGIFENAINNLINFARRAGAELLAIVKEFLLTQLVNFIRNHTNAYELIKVIIGKDPITDEPVARNGTNILNALLELGGEQGREQRTQMQDTGSFQKAADWIDRGIAVFSNLYQTIRNNVGLIWNAVSIESLMDPIGTFNRLYETFAEPVRQVLNFVAETLQVILGFIKEVLLQRLSAWARTVRGYALVTVLIGKDPFTNQVVPRSVANIIRGFMSLMEGGEEQYRQMEESGAIARATQRINAAVARLNMTPASILQLFMDLWNSFSFNDLAHPVAAFQRIIDRFGQPIARLIAFVVEIVKIVVEVILQVMNFPFDLIGNIINRAMAAFESIKRDPIGFLKNLLRAIKQGFLQFFDNIVTHLVNGVVGWLMSELRDANIPELRDFSLRGVIAWVLQVLGISMEAIWQKLAAHPRVGPERVARIRGMINTLEGIWTFIRDVQQRGMAAIWDKIQEQLSNLWNTILDAVKNWIMERIVSQVTARLLSMLDPTGIMAVINSAIAIYRAIQSFMRYLRQMLEVVNSFVNGVADIAAGNVSTAANYLERTMGRAMPIVIGFLANQVGLSGIGRRIGEMITRVREMVDRALTWLVNRAVNTGFAVIDRLLSMGREAVGGGGTPQQRLDNALRDGQSAVNRFAGSRVGAIVLNPLLTVIKLRYGLQSLEVVPRGNLWAVRGVINPTGEATTTVQVGAAAAVSNEQQVLEALVPNRPAPVYGVDGLGRASGSHGHVQGVKSSEERENIPTLLPTGYLPGDHRGHLIGDRFYGSNLGANIVPMHSTLNLSTFKTFENSLASGYNLLKNQNKGVLLYMNIVPQYPGSDSHNSTHFRPTTVTANCKIIKLKPNTTPPQTEEQLFSPSPFSNPAPVLAAINVNTAAEADLVSLFGTPLGRLLARIRGGGFAGFQDMQYRVALAAGSQLEQFNENIRSKENLIRFRTATTQPKLSTGNSTDHHEREADHIADKVTGNNSISSPMRVTPIGKTVQQKTATEKIRAPAIKLAPANTQHNRGSPLPTATRTHMESRMGADFSNVRIHTGAASQQATASIGARAFTQGVNIHFAQGEFKPQSKTGQHLLAHELAHTMQQGASPSKRSASKTNSTKTTSRSIAASRDQKNPSPQVADTKSKKIAGQQPAGETSKTPGGKEAKQKSPSSPEEDPAFQQTIRRAKSTTKQQRSHELPGKKADDAQAFAGPVAFEAESKAQNRKTGSISEAAKEDHPFTPANFKADLLAKIEEITPQTLEAADDFKEKNRIGEVKAEVGSKVAEEKKGTVGPVTRATVDPLKVNPEENKKSLDLPSTDKGPRPGSIGAKNAVPKQKTEDEISMQEQSASLDDEMKQNNVTEDQLQGSNEPSFQSALKEKKSAQKDAVEKPLLYRKQETAELKAAQAEAGGKAASSLAGMHDSRGKNFEAVVSKQGDGKKSDEDARAKVARDINEKYIKTEGDVTRLLGEAETLSGQIFDKGAEDARKIFEDYADQQMRAYKADRYSGLLGGGRWLKDKFFDLPGEVNQFYVDGKKLYLEKMDKVLTEVSTIIAEKLNAAKKAIVDGKKEIDDFVKGLPEALITVGEQAAEQIGTKFESLEQTVKDKGQQLVDGLAKKYVDNVKKLDERITELKEANKGLISKAIGLLKAVWQAIKNIYNLFKTILSKLVQIVGVILGAPGKFFGNLGAAFNKGFDMFKSRLDEHLENGLMIWLSTQLGVADLKLPPKFDINAIFSLALQVMGISYAHIRERAVLQIGEERVALMETTAGLFQRIYKEGLGAVWEIIKEKFTDFKDMIWEAIKTFIRDAVIRAAITLLLSLLNPVAAFVKACMAIYDFLMMLVKMKDRIIDLINSILDAVMTIAHGSVDAAASAIEKAFAKSIPIIIGFLAALLHLNNIGSKVRDIILRIRARVDKLLDWMIGKAYSLVGPAVEGAMRLKNKGKDLLEKGKEKVMAVGTAAKNKVLGWMGLKKNFTDENNQPHTIFFDSSGNVIVASDEIPLPKLLHAKKTEIEEMDSGRAKTTKATALANATTLMKQINSIKNKIETAANDDERRSYEHSLNTLFNSIVPHLIKLGISMATKKELPQTIINYSPGSNGRADKVVADPLTKKTDGRYNAGRPSVDPSGWTTHIETIPNYDAVYVRLHILSEKLGGPGNKVWNLTAGRKIENTNMESQAETPAHNLIKQNKVLWYESEITGYRQNEPFTDFATGIRVKYGLKDKNDSGQWNRVGNVQYNNVFAVSQPDMPGTRDVVPSINTVSFNYWDDVLKDIPGRPTRDDYRALLIERNKKKGYDNWNSFINSTEMAALKAKYPGAVTWFLNLVKEGKLRKI